MATVSVATLRPMRRVLAVTLAGALAVVACSSSSDDTTLEAPSSTTASTQPARPMVFESWTETFIDARRVTPAGTETPEYPERALATTIYLPEGDGAAPLIVFSHGLMGHPDKFTQLLSSWAEAGYVVAAPAFPLTNDRVPGAPRGFSDLPSQPGDVSFVMDELLAANADPASRLAGRIDPERIAAAGLSLGGATTYAVTFNPCCRDDRVTASMVLAGALIPAFSDDYVLDGRVPLLIVHGDQDLALPYSNAVEAFSVAAPPVWLVTLIGGAHATPFENDVTPFDQMVADLTVDFWDATLGGDDTAFDRFEQHAAVDGLSALEQRVR
jgi:predicted dienelactone hydrolase